MMCDKCLKAKALRFTKKAAAAGMEKVKRFYRRSTLPGLIAIGISINTQEAAAQLMPLSSQYYHNQYAANPAFAGVSEGLSVNMAYRNQWRSIPGSPVSSSVTGDYRFDNKVGVGLKIYTDKAGLISRNAVSGSYAYHLPLSTEGQELHFGISLGVMKDKLDVDNIVGEDNDLVAGAFNSRKIYIDGDFGLAYTNKRFNMQAAIPNMKVFFKKDESNSVQLATMYLAMSYKIGQSPEMLSIEPKVSYWAADGIDNIWNLAAKVNLLDETLSFTGMLNSTKSSSLGLGIDQKRFLIQGFYTSHLAGQRESTGGSFELHLRIKLLNKENPGIQSAGF